MFSVPIEKEVTNIAKYDNDSVFTIFSKTKLIDSARFMASSLSNHVDNLAEVIHKISVKIVIVIVIFFLNMKESRTIL